MFVTHNTALFHVIADRISKMSHQPLKYNCLSIWFCLAQPPGNDNPTHVALLPRNAYGPVTKHIPQPSAGARRGASYFFHLFSALPSLQLEGPDAQPVRLQPVGQPKGPLFQFAFL
jgi:hypothetical protein